MLGDVTQDGEPGQDDSLCQGRPRTFFGVMIKKDSLISDMDPILKDGINEPGKNKRIWGVLRTHLTMVKLASRNGPECCIRLWEGNLVPTYTSIRELIA
ncbi:5473_t:CDS:2 [Cetraspora pellucida]|uniref:5473_t:CDS:1 n=1 Tax=Cetraspora pellucida TaxID=1433469 RepID=A0ACA9K790_9GLOM|nr:5473_t:CDS:2 [Cetraspora pellucida]